MEVSSKLHDEGKSLMKVCIQINEQKHPQIPHHSEIKEEAFNETKLMVKIRRINVEACVA